MKESRAKYSDSASRIRTCHPLCKLSKVRMSVYKTLNHNAQGLNDSAVFAFVVTRYNGLIIMLIIRSKAPRQSTLFMHKGHIIL